MVELILGRQIGVAIESGDDVTHVPVTVMVDGMLETTDPAADVDRFVHPPRLEATFAALQQTNLVIGVETAIPQPLPPEIVATGNGIAIGEHLPRALPQLRHLIPELRTD